MMGETGLEVRGEGYVVDPANQLTTARPKLIESIQ